MPNRRGIFLTVLLAILCRVRRQLTPRLLSKRQRHAGRLAWTATWQTFVLDSTGDVGYFTSIAVDKNDKIHISYLDNTNRVLKYATNTTGAWVVTTSRSLRATWQILPSGWTPPARSTSPT